MGGARRTEGRPCLIEFPTARRLGPGIGPAILSEIVPDRNVTFPMLAGVEPGRMAP